MTSTLDKMKDLLRAGDMCVLATCVEDKPHCSLMAYVTDELVTEVYMVTLKRTRKYQNFLRNPYVSLLVDTRYEQPPRARKEVQALTASGTFHPLAEAGERQRIVQEMAAKHPHLETLLAHEDVEPFAIRIDSFLLLDGALDAHFLEI
jgi:nitroimidazol reductase NimA-like FMN-containing flavoprotein (pyridoxamine 5'-phosphate oxidase superfamily)